MNKVNTLYSFVVPIYNDGFLAEEFCKTFQKVFRDWLTIDQIEDQVELILVNDGSRDDSMKYLRLLPAKYYFVKIIELSRNFGQHIALSCGYKHAKGDYVGMLNVDMEDSPSEIPKMIKHLDGNDCDIVLGVRENRKSRFFIKITSFLFNYVLNKLTGYDIPTNVATLRIMNRKFTDAYNALTEKSRFIPGLERWLGFKHCYLPIDHNPRVDGGSSYNFKRRMAMAIYSILSFSDLPLRWIAYFGLAMSVLGFLSSVLIVLLKLFFVDFQAGYVSTLAIFVLLSGVQIIVIGTASLYIGRILREVQNRPLYDIRNTYNL